MRTPLTTTTTATSTLTSTLTAKLTATATASQALEASTPVTHQIYAGLRRWVPSRGRALAATPDLTSQRTTELTSELTPDPRLDPESSQMSDQRRLSGDRGAVSLEQVLWFVASGVSVAVVAGVLWSRIREQAETPIQPPSAP